MLPPITMKLAELFETIENVKWVVGNLGTSGLLLKSQGTTIKLDDRNADALIAAFKANDEVVVKTTDNLQFRFEPSPKGFILTQEDDDGQPDSMLVTKDDVAQIISVAAGPKQENPTQ